MIIKDNVHLIKKYFPDISHEQEKQFGLLSQLYTEWNQKINVISRKDVDSLYVHHVLHSLAIARFINFKPKTQLLDVGTGGGFPGVPLAIMFPECDFKLIDSIAKKIKVVDAVSTQLGLKNITATQQRAEELKEKFDFVVGRAVTTLPIFASWVWNKIKSGGQNVLPNGIICLKGGDLSHEINELCAKFRLSKKQLIEDDVSKYFDEEYFETKKIIYIQR